MANIFYVYLHKRATDGSIFYVGKGSGNRSTDFTHRSLHWKYVANKYGVVVDIALDNLSEDEAFAEEVRLIALHGRKDKKSGTLVNKSDGGEGPSGMRLSDDARRIISQRQLGDSNIAKRPEVRKKLSAAMAAHGNPMSDPIVRAKSAASRVGIKISSETRLKLSKSHLGKVFSKSTCEKISAIRTGKDRGAEFRETMRKAMLKRWADPVKRNELLLAQRKAAKDG